MSRAAIISGLCGLTIAMMWRAPAAEADWPSGGARVIPVSACSTWGYAGDRLKYVSCPFLSDSISYWGGANSSIYVDFNQVHTNQAVNITSCWTSSTGTATYCLNATQNQASGNFDLYVPGFANTTAMTQEPTDYYSVVIYGRDAYTVYGITYF